MMGDHVYEVIVIGAGVEGSSTSYYLTSRHTSNVLLLEQFDRGHTRGSSHGGSRITRRAYDKPFYVPIMKEAFSLWEEIEQKSGTQLYWKTGFLAIGKPNTGGAKLYRDSLERHKMAYKYMSGKEAKKMFPRQLNVPDNYECVYENEAGVLKASKAVLTLQNLFVCQGGDFRDNHKVTGLLPGTIVTVQTDKGDFRAKRVIITAGAWTNKVLQPLNLSLYIKVYRAEVLYFKVEDPEAFSAGSFPVFLSARPHNTTEASVYGTPILEYPGLLKVCQYYTEDIEVDPEARDAIPRCLTLPKVTDFINVTFKGVSMKPAIFELCMYADTPDSDPYIDRHPLWGNIVVGAGFSHGFKMGPVIGKMLSEMALDLPPTHDLSPFRIDRFRLPKALL